MRTLLPFLTLNLLQRKLALEYHEAASSPIWNLMQWWKVVPDLGVLSNAHWHLSFCKESSNLQLCLIIVGTQHHCVLEPSCDLCQNNVADYYQMWESWEKGNDFGSSPIIFCKRSKLQVHI